MDEPAPLSPPLSLSWQLPSPVRRWPAWLREAARHLESTGAALCMMEGEGERPGATASRPARAAAGEPVRLCLDFASAAAAQGVRCWLLTDGQGQTLAIEAPLWSDITAREGLQLALWERGPGDAAWQPLRRLHLGVTARYDVARRRLPDALARLLRQACLAQRLGVPAGPPLTGADAAALGRAAPGTRGGHFRMALRGLWRESLVQHRARWLREVWQIGVIDAPLGDVIRRDRLPPVRWLGTPSDMGYWADPVADANSPRHLYAEFYDDRSGVGRIERLALGPDDRIEARETMSLGGGAHVSFPLMVDLDGRRLGLVETAARRECVLHEIDDQGHWRPMATLLQGVAAADPALFKWQDRYWLAYTDIDLGPVDNLCLQHAPTLEGPWQPHANNPVKVDVTGARMAGGLFWHEGALYRPAQNCMPTYGSALAVHRVLRCTPTDYAEETVARFAPEPAGPCPDGMHTLNAWGTRTLVDGKRRVFHLPTVWLKLCRRFGWHP